MAVNIGEVVTSVEVTPTAPVPTAPVSSTDSPGDRERARRAGERGARIARRTSAEGYDD